jgi:signal transduction histidine kinase/serine/threonine protein kinase/tetratricopeptide (TPR) repeat protein
MIIDSRYEVIHKVGTGLWSTVYKVKDIRTDRILALKLFEELDTTSLYEKFSAEDMHHITKIKHPNLIHVSDFGNHKKNIYYISEFYTGKTLSKYKFSLSNIEDLYDIIINICYALNALHSQNIIHKDLKPDNVAFKKLKNRLEVKVMDYGFTKVYLDRNKQQVSGSLPYIAPEIYLGSGAVQQSDFYSLGVILYKITTGILPFTVEQISGFIAGNDYNLFPKFPREINPIIPIEMEKLMLKLLENNPEDRFENIQSIITYINNIQLKAYPFSGKWSIVNNIRFSDYIVRSDYSHKLLDYIPIVESSNGKLIILSAGKGLGKNNALTLFRYHLLNDDYFLFDYTCSETNKDPFFALIKEYRNASEKNKELAEDLTHISDKLKKYLFESEEKATEMEESAEELVTDFETAAHFVFHLSEEKPIVFIIRAAEFLTDEAKAFVKHISKEITDRKVLIILSNNDSRKFRSLAHAVHVRLESLNYEQVKDYVFKLLNREPPEEFIKALWERSYGNPMFIENILIDLTKSLKIWKSNKFNFQYDFDEYVLPKEIKTLIFERMTHLSQKNYKSLKILSILKFPFSRILMKKILGIDDKELFFVLQEGTNSELLMKQNENYIFTFKDVRNRFKSECSKELTEDISKKVLTYYYKSIIGEDVLINGLIEHAELLNDYAAVRNFQLKLIRLYTLQKKYERSFEELCKVIELDFSGKLTLDETSLKKDLALLVEKSDWTTSGNVSESLKRYISAMPDISEKHLMMGLFYLMMEKTKLGIVRLKKALNLAVSGRMRIVILLKLAYAYVIQSKPDKLKECLDIIQEVDLPEKMRISFVALRGIYMGFENKTDEAIQMMEDYISTLEDINDPGFFIKLGFLHNSLGVMYHRQRDLEQANKHFLTAAKIWEQINYRRRLCSVYNNIGDVAITRGDTQTAFSYFDKAFEICMQIDCKRGLTLNYLNQGQAYIKLGHFDIAEYTLEKAMNESMRLENKPFLESIVINMAIARSKIKNFGYYYGFVKKNQPELTEGIILKVTPLVKTFFYYLKNIGDYKKIESMLNANKEKFLESGEDEFYYQMHGFVSLNKKDYNSAILETEKAFKYSRKISSVYAQAINYIRLTECYLETGELSKAVEMCNSAESICEKNKFFYWKTVHALRKIKIKLLDEKISLRMVIRELISLLKYIQDHNLFILEIEVYEMIVQIYKHLNSNKKAKLYFDHYKEKLEHATIGMPVKDKQMYLKKNKYFVSDFSKLNTLVIKKRVMHDIDLWQEELFDILKLKETSRMKFFIDKTIMKLLAPYSYAIILSEELKYKKAFMSFNLTNTKLHSEKFLLLMEQCIDTNKIIHRRLSKINILFVPLRIRTSVIGCLILTDKGELNFQVDEINIIKILKLHLTSILMRINEFETLNKNMLHITQLVEVTQKFFSTLDTKKLEQQVVEFTLEFINGSRGFLIRKDKFENYVYKVAVDSSKHLLNSYAYISKPVLRDVQTGKKPIYIPNAKAEKIFEGYMDLDSEFLSIYCAPIFTDSKFYGFIYIDNYNATDNIIQVNRDFMRLLFIQISEAFKNAAQYETLAQKNHEIESLDSIKDDFIKIVSHELRTPLVTLQGYNRRVSKFLKNEKAVTLSENMGKSIKKLIYSTTDIINYNKYLMLKRLKKSRADIKEVITILAEEAREISSKRHMQIFVEAEQVLPPMEFHWDGVHLMIRNLILNAIRFTNDFGMITIGVRNSTFQQEEINGKESIVIYVQDNGIGIPQKDLDNVFRKFFELTDVLSHSSGTIEYRSSGLGLGLSTSKLIAELHKGKIRIKSKENEGTTVYVSLPVISGKK